MSVAKKQKISSTETVRAMTAVINHETPRALKETMLALEETTLALERARMTAEDFRGGNGAEPGFPTWRQMERALWNDNRRMSQTLTQIAIEARGDITTNNIRNLTADWFPFPPEPEEEIDSEESEDG